MCLLEQYKPGMAGYNLYSQFMMFGNAPMIIGPVTGQRFFGVDYARDRACEFCSACITLPNQERQMS